MKFSPPIWLLFWSHIVATCLEKTVAEFSGQNLEASSPSVTL